MLYYDRVETPLGPVTLIKSNGGICYIGLPNIDPHIIDKWIEHHFPSEKLRAAPVPFSEERRRLLDFLTGRTTEIGFNLDHRNSAFNKEVLQYVSNIPYGATATYGEIAKQMGKPGAARAVGRANATNPLPLAIPCHRVIGSGGKLTGYGGGLLMKRRLLSMEARSC